MQSLQSILEKVTRENNRAKMLRRYIVVEPVYQNSGQIAPLDVIIRLKEKYCFRVVLDESNSFGVLGSSGRGLSEHFGVPIEKIDIIAAAMGHALATDGGFCTGSVRVVGHQRLSSAGYVFSASLPPYLACAAITAIDVLEEHPSLLTKVHSILKDIYLIENSAWCRFVRYSDIPGLSFPSNPLSPIVFFKLKNSTGSFEKDLKLLEDIVNHVLKEDSVLLISSIRSTLDKYSLPAGIRMFVSASHLDSDLLKGSEALKRAATFVLLNHD
ncbi:hypothetical protein AAC387_Pa03g3683 [Persea americana]